MEEKEIFTTYAIVEIMGRKVISGLVTEQVIAGQGFIRVDVPEIPGQDAFTQFYGPGSIYAITPTTKEIATAFAARNVGAPIQPYQLRLPTPPKAEEDDDGEDENFPGVNYHSDGSDVPF